MAAPPSLPAADAAPHGSDAGAGWPGLAAPPPATPRRRRYGRWAAGALALLVLLVAVLAGGAWWWAGSAQSLAAVLARAARYLPAGQTLETRDITGSLRTGGHIGWLRWQGPTLAVEVQGADIGWQLAPLLQRRLHLGEVHAARITITRTGPPDDSPTEPPARLLLPLDIDIPFRVDDLRWAGPPAVQATGLAGRYRYGDGSHSLVVDGVDVAGGHYAATATLGGDAPLRLDATLRARLAPPLPDGAAPLPVGVGLVLRGTLAAADARLQVHVAVRPAADATAMADAAGNPPPAMRADASADIAPWAPQPLLRAQAALAGLDVARLLPGAPATLLDGTMEATPQAAGPAAAPPRTPPAAPGSAPASTGWQLHTALRNGLPGPWDQGRVPVALADADVAIDPAGTWTVQHAVLQAGGGSITLSGQWGPPPIAVADPAPTGAPAAPAAPAPGSPPPPAAAPAPAMAPWEARATVQGVAPGQLHTQLEGPAIGGTLEARSLGGGRAIGFGADLSAAPEAAPPTRTARRNAGPASALPTGLALRSAAVAGTWDSTASGGTLDLKTLRIRTADASAEGTLQLRPADKAGRGKLALVLPGGRAEAEGDMAPARGSGRATLKLANVAALQRWVEQLPGLAGAFGGARLDGTAQADARWTGGWEPALRRWQQGSLPASAAANELNLQLTASAPQLALALPPSRATDKPPVAARQQAGRTAKEQAARPAPAPAAASTPPTDPNAPNRRGFALSLRGMRLEVAGSLAQARLSLQGAATSGTQSATLRTQATGGMEGPGRWRATVAALDVEAQDTTLPGPWRVALAAPVDLRVRQGGEGKAAAADALAFDASAGSATLQGPVPGAVKLSWSPLAYAQSGSGAAARYRLRTQGRLEGLPMAWAQALVAGGNDSMRRLGLQGDLVFDGDWDIDAGEVLKARATLARRSGDIRVQAGAEAAPVTTRISSSGTGTGAESAAASAPAVPTTAAGVREARVTVNAEGEALRAEVVWDSERAGQVRATAGTQLKRVGDGWDWVADAPLSGTLRARLPSVGVWSVLAPPGWRVQGTLEADATLAGTRAAPQWSGTLAADGLSMRSVVDGIELRDGKLRTALRGDRLDITEFSLRGGTGSSTRIAGYAGSLATARSTAAPADGGSLQASGFVAWGGGLRMELNAEAKALRVSVRADRQVTVSGTVGARTDDGRLVLRGNLKTDRAVVILPDDTAPTLGSDVVVRSAAKDAEAAKQAAAQATGPTRIGTAKPPDVQVRFDLGDDFAVQGHGITTRLAGQLDIRSTEGLSLPPRITGEIRTVRGQYRAYGQQLDIESGLARFNGPYDNPALDILAIRPNITVRAGVQVLGTAQSPQVRLYSDPVLTDAETLSWVVLGRSTANGGAEAALLQQAALAFLSGNKGSSGNVAKRLGLDDIGFKGPGTGADASSAALTFGKRISQKFYLSYEHSLSGALGTIYIFYDLTRRLTLRGQTGGKSALDLIYTLSYD